MVGHVAEIVHGEVDEQAVTREQESGDSEPASLRPQRY
jgi:hypothetical protein